MATFEEVGTAYAGANKKTRWSIEDRKTLLRMGGKFSIDEIAEALGTNPQRVINKANGMMLNLRLNAEAKKRVIERAN